MIHVYLAGPFSADTPQGREENKVAAEDWALEVFREGMVPVYTHRMWGSFYGKVQERDVIEAGLSLLSRCDCVFVYDGHSTLVTSRGTRMEVTYAKSLHKPIFYNFQSLRLTMGTQCAT